jgi:dihydropteroate synthase
MFALKLFSIKQVAKACIEAGADLINDVSGGLSDVNMLPTVAALNVPYCIMHMRGSPSTMQQPPHIVYERGVTQTVKVELGLRVEAALKAGVKRWNIIVDPGIGTLFLGI